MTGQKSQGALQLELERARRDADTWRELLAGARTTEGEKLALRGLADAQKREREALEQLYKKCAICGQTRADEWRDELGGYICTECAGL